MFTKTKLSYLAMVMFLSLCVAGISYSQVKGMCGNCHTMHNSQNGNHMMLNAALDGEEGGDHGGGYPALTRGTCVGCHTGSNTPGATTPYVFDVGAVTYGTDTLAGGNFKWAVTDDAKGHNVSGIPGMTADVALAAGAPGGPGGGMCGTDSCHTTLYNPTNYSNTATLDTGCEGCHLEPKHHAPQQAAGAVAGEANGYFRFLSGHSPGEGVHGIEAADRELNSNASNHNEYLGSTTSTTNTMTGYCVGCHGDFHNQKDNDKWIRHPSDAIIPTTGEYAAYTAYDPNVPVARLDLAAIGLVAEVVTPGTDMVMCLSCHRAHGSPYDDLLRWSYDGMIAGGGAGSAPGTGCFVCHTEKDS